MTDTPRLALPLVAPSQAQKHVTVNEAFARLDALTQLVLVSATETTPPASPAEGTVHFVPTGAVDDWAGQEGRLAIFQGGGWVFVDPVTGWRAWLVDPGHLVTWSGTAWQPVGLGAAPSGAAMSIRSIEIEHAVQSAASSTTVPLLPAGSVVFAVTGIVTAEVTGGATGFRLGVAGSPDRYGSGIGVAAGSWLRGLTSSPMAYYADTPLLLTAEGGTFSGGSVLLVAHVGEFSLPSAT